MLSKTGGHLGPNHGVVELTLAMHYVFDTPKDHFVFDVSHQAYVHKLLTGRREQFHSIRTPGGLNGFMLRTESPHDCYGAGHAGTALSAALGMAVARDRIGGNEHVVALAGDAAFTCGITYEALNNIANSTRRLIVLLNDNEWSIDKNVGAIANYLNTIVTNPRFDYLHEQAGRFVERMGGKTALHMARKAEEAAKSILWPSVIFEELGLKYYGPIDGHDIATLIKTFDFLKRQQRPVLLHVLTQKGKGFEPALQKQKEVSVWTGAVRSGNRRNQGTGATHLLGGLRRHHGQVGRHEQQSCGHHGSDAERHGPRSFPAPSSQPVF